MHLDRLNKIINDSLLELEPADGKVCVILR